MNLYELQEIVSELIASGQGESLVVVSSDSEGNSFAKMSDNVGIGYYHTKYHEFYDEEWVDEEEIDKADDNLKNTVAFFPSW